MKKVHILLKQHIGNISTPIVKVGDKVQKGQLIAQAYGLGANIHSSVSGTVIAINNEVIIEAAEKQPKDYIKLKKMDTKLEMIKQAGIVGAGGAGFPTDVKFASDITNGVVIINAAECEPLLHHNIKYIEENTEEFVKGIVHAIDITKAKQAYVAIKTKHKNAIINLAKKIKMIDNIKIKFLPDIYPAGDERVIIRELLGVILNPGELPIKANAIVSNVETIKNIKRAINDRKPVITKDITVGGKLKSGTSETVYFDVPIGVNVGEYIDKAGGKSPWGEEILIGGPFTGVSGDYNTPITKTTGGIFVGIEFPQIKKKFGLIECECGATADRLTEIVEKMGGEVVAVQRCKRMKLVNGRYRCEKPGVCPGQASTVIKLKTDGAEAILTGT